VSRTTIPITAKTRKAYDPKPAREALAAKFATPEEASAHYSTVGKKGADQRVILSGAEKEALSSAYQLLARIVARQPAKFGVDVDE
jgi:hypothetical protein